MIGGGIEGKINVLDAFSGSAGNLI